MPPTMNDITRILYRIESGDPSAADLLLPLVYAELRKLAGRKMSNEADDHTLEATALVHEAYLRLVDVDESQHWDSRGHFFSAAAEAMRRILVEQARRKRGPKAGGRHRQIELSNIAPEIPGPELDLLALDEALEKLQATDERAANVVKLRFFAGLTRKQTAELLGISTATADNDWAYAKGFLRLELSGAQRS